MTLIFSPPEAPSQNDHALIGWTTVDSSSAVYNFAYDMAKSMTFEVSTPGQNPYSPGATYRAYAEALVASMATHWYLSYEASSKFSTDATVATSQKERLKKLFGKAYAFFMQLYAKSYVDQNAVIEMLAIPWNSVPWPIFPWKWFGAIGSTWSATQWKLVAEEAAKSDLLRPPYTRVLWEEDSGTYAFGAGLPIVGSVSVWDAQYNTTVPKAIEAPVPSFWKFLPWKGTKAWGFVPFDMVDLSLVRKVIPAQVANVLTGQKASPEVAITLLQRDDGNAITTPEELIFNMRQLRMDLGETCAKDFIRDSKTLECILNPNAGKMFVPGKGWVTISGWIKPDPSIVNSHVPKLTCPSGQHFDAKAGKCVMDPIDLGALGGGVQIGGSGGGGSGGGGSGGLPSDTGSATPPPPDPEVVAWLACLKTGGFYHPIDKSCISLEGVLPSYMIACMKQGFVYDKVKDDCGKPFEEALAFPMVPTHSGVPIGPLEMMKIVEAYKACFAPEQSVSIGDQGSSDTMRIWDPQKMVCETIGGGGTDNPCGPGMVPHPVHMDECISEGEMALIKAKAKACQQQGGVYDIKNDKCLTQTGEDDKGDEETKSNTGLYVGLAAAVVLAAGVGWAMTRPKTDEAEPPPESSLSDEDQAL